MAEQGMQRIVVTGAAVTTGQAVAAEGEAPRARILVAFNEPADIGKLDRARCEVHRPALPTVAIGAWAARVEAGALVLERPDEEVWQPVAGEPVYLVIHYEGQDLRIPVEVVDDVPDVVPGRSEPRSVERDILAYPVWTAEVGGGASGGSTAAAGGSLEDVLDRQVYEVLGGVPDDADARTIASTLERSFTATEVDGSLTVSYTPGSYVAQTSIGAGVTGLQANLVATSRREADAALPLIDALSPLLDTPEADPELIAASKGLLAEAMQAFVGEVGVDGGPRQPRAGLLLRQMEGAVDDLGWRLSMTNAGAIDRTHVVNAADEDDVSNFIAVSNAVATMKRLYDDYVGGGNGNPPPSTYKDDLGRKFVLLSRSLARVGELVDDVARAMDSVRIGKREREQIFLTDINMTIEDLLSWMSSFATTEATYLIERSGRRGARIVADTIGAKGPADPADRTLRSEVQRLIDVAEHPAPGTGLPDGLSHPRVLAPLNDLLKALGPAFDDADAAALQAGPLA